MRPTDYAPVLLAEDAAALLGFPTERAAKEWLGRERAPHVVIAGRHAWLREDLLAWLRARQVTADELAERDAAVARLVPRRGRA